MVELLAMDIRYKGRVERGSNVSSTSPSLHPYICPILHSRQPLWAMAWWESSRHGYTDKGRVERGSNVSSTSPSHRIIHIFVLYPPHSPASLGNGMVGVFSPWIYGQGKGRKRVKRELYFTSHRIIHIFVLYPPQS